MDLHLRPLSPERLSGEPLKTPAGKCAPRSGVNDGFIGAALMLFGLLTPIFPAAHAAPAVNDSAVPANVILVTLDGVRYQDFFQTPRRPASETVPFESFWREIAPRGFVIGGKDGPRPMEVANAAIASLPAYMSIFSGKSPFCFTNACARIRSTTFPERLVRELQIPRERVASFGSWSRLKNALESHPGTTVVNTGAEAHTDSAADAELARLNAAQSIDLPPWHRARWDKYTFAHGMRYLRLHQPRFLYLSFNDADVWAHQGQRSEYRATLRQYDEWFKQLVETVDSMENYGENTTIILTTDHGRGRGRAWTKHGAPWRHSRFVWLFAMGPETRNPKVRRYSHRDIRPTIEASFGIQPQDCRRCGSRIF